MNEELVTIAPAVGYFHKCALSGAQSGVLQ
jgi:hypothetical protein